jgi:hypothetical protein
MLSAMDRLSDLPRAAAGFIILALWVWIVAEVVLWLINLVFTHLTPVPSGPFQPYQ